LTAALLQPGWNTAYWLADTLFIYPGGYKKDGSRKAQDTKTYEVNRDEFLELKRINERQVKE
jgi:hypothetical protein